ncbi:MAG TPA: GNAT family N-acetyltransferase [Ferruginibacter sp.]|nr:GNAT family N-acetyltransferase [Ferruginibacter sp.]HMP21887.1 GNAT family N-acetyltransferase [Ferruginibacter sp.]
MLLEIRKAIESDAASIALLFDAYRVFYQQPSNLPAAFEFISQRITADESVIFIAVMDGEVAGFVQLYPIFSSVRLKRAWLLNDLFVAEKHRRKGIAEALLEQTKEFGIETDAAWIILETASDNYWAQSVYEKNGWIKSGSFFYEYPVQ